MRECPGIGITRNSSRHTTRTWPPRRLARVLQRLRLLCGGHVPSDEEAYTDRRPPLGPAWRARGSQQERHSVLAEQAESAGIDCESRHGANPATYGDRRPHGLSGLAFPPGRVLALEAIFAPRWPGLSRHG